MKNLKVVIISVAATLIVCAAAFMIWNYIDNEKTAAVDSENIKTAESAEKSEPDFSKPDEGSISADGSEYICNHTYDEGNYILEDSNIRKLDKKDLKKLTVDELCLARNEIYARHGRLFNDKDIQAYFASQSWYSGVIEPEDFKESVLSDVEIANVELILSVEEARAAKGKKSKE